MSAPLVVNFGSEICGSYEAAIEREWLVTNGLGGFACGTVAGALTRRYHGLLIAALPGIGRTLLVSKAEEEVRYAGSDYALSANRWTSNIVEPHGYRFIEQFHLTGSIPVWKFALADAVLEKRVWMQDGANTTFLRYDLVYATAPVDLKVKIIVNYRDMHYTTRAGEWNTSVTTLPQGLRLIAREGAVPIYLLSDLAKAEARHEWYRNYDLSAERERGLDDHEDHLLAGVFSVSLAPGGSVLLAFSTEPEPALEGRTALTAREGLDQRLFENWIAAHPRASLDAPRWIWQYVLAAAQFPIRRRTGDGRESWSLVAGYPWFGEWGRDTMIALPGLALETGRAEVARSILSEFPRFAREGLFPNTFAEDGGAAAYNTVDAMLWYIHALQQYASRTSDLGLVREVFDAVAAAVDWYARGTRYGIHMDHADGLLHAGEPGVQPTWMDAKVGDRVITPRTGKAVEVNALWFNALRALARWAADLGKAPEEYARLAERTKKSFARFWNADKDCCFDVIDGPDGDDPAVRPNQIFAVSLPHSPIDASQRKRVVDICARRLLTPHGLRSLDPADASYRGHYGGPPLERDAAYHEGTVWAWLLGPFVLAHLRVYGNPARAYAFLEPMAHHLSTAGLGSASEIFDGDAPFVARGAIAQAWSVGEILHAWQACYEAGLKIENAVKG